MEYSNILQDLWMEYTYIYIYKLMEIYNYNVYELEI